MPDTSNPSVDVLIKTAETLRREACRMDEQATYLRTELVQVEEGAKQRRANADQMEATAERLSTVLVVEVSEGPVDRHLLAKIRHGIDAALSAGLVST